MGRQATLLRPNPILTCHVATPACAGVLVSSMKLIAFHGCFSWLTFRVMNLPLTYTASAACSRLTSHAAPAAWGVRRLGVPSGLPDLQRPVLLTSSAAGFCCLSSLRPAAICAHICGGAAWLRGAAGAGACGGERGGGGWGAGR